MFANDSRWETTIAVWTSVPRPGHGSFCGGLQLMWKLNGRGGSKKQDTQVMMKSGPENSRASAEGRVPSSWFRWTLQVPCGDRPGSRYAA